jgi:DeoR/GlpR family transcriptional regulator of sugar metabolism
MQSVLTAERRQTLLDLLARDGKLVVAQLVQDLGVSEDTVRRDLRELSVQGLLRRVHGGALPAPPERTFERRLALAPEAKGALADAALKVIEGADVIVLDGGTSTLELARRLPPERVCTILTNAPPIAAALASHPCAEVVVLGGRLLKESLVTVGSETVDALRGVRPDVCVLGVCSLHPELGVTSHDREESEVKRAMAAASGEVAMLATADKLGTASPWVVVPLADVTYLVTDATPEQTAAYAAAGVTVLHA